MKAEVIVSPAERQRIDAVLAYAREYIYRPGAERSGRGSSPHHVAPLGMALRAVFWLAEGSDGATCRHLRVSFSAPPVSLPNAHSTSK